MVTKEVGEVTLGKKGIVEGQATGVGETVVGDQVALTEDLSKDP